MEHHEPQRSMSTNQAAMTLLKEAKIVSESA